MDYKKCAMFYTIPQRKIPIPKSKPKSNHFSNDNNSDGEKDDLRYQYDLKPDVFDPFSSSPPQTFMLKLKARLGISTNNQCGDAEKTNDLMRESE
jgi:hypothetical protein